MTVGTGAYRGLTSQFGVKAPGRSVIHPCRGSGELGYARETLGNLGKMRAGGAAAWIVTLCMLSASGCFDETSIACTEGNFLNGSTCEPCRVCGEGEYRAAECSGSNNAECTPCSPACAANHFETSPCAGDKDVVCSPCHETCGTCRSEESDACLTCKGLFLNAENECVPFTDSGQRLGNSYSVAVALGDLDGDGDLDAFIGNTKFSPNGVAPNKVWLNNGKGEFTDSGQSLGSGRSYDVALGDLDGDGDLDAIVANDEGADAVWFNDGRGAFSFSANLGQSRSHSVALGDLDKDGDLDAVIAKRSESSQVWLNSGEGEFTDSGQSIGSGSGSNVVLADLDGDMLIDLFHATTSVSDTVWLNDGEGGLASSGVSVVGNRGGIPALGDLNGDGHIDVFLGRTLFTADGVLLNDGLGNFTATNQLLGHRSSSDVALADLDGDGDLDVFTIQNDNHTTPNTVWLNDGEGSFTDSGQSPGTFSSHDVELADLDGDGDLDVFVARTGPNLVLTLD